MARELIVKIDTQTRKGEEGLKRFSKSLDGLLAPLRSINPLMAALGGGGIALFGRSLIQTAMEAGTTSESFWRFQDATYELRRTLGELLIKALGPVTEVLAKFASWLTKAIDSVRLFLWRNWETILEGIASNISGLIRLLAAFNGASDQNNTAMSEMGRTANVLGATFASLGKGVLLGLFDPLVKLGGAFQQLGRGLAETIPFVKAIGEWLGNLVPSMSDILGVLGKVIGGFEGVGRIIGGLLQQLNPVIGVFDGLFNILSSVIAIFGLLSNAVGATGEVFRSVGNTITEIWNTLIAFLSDALKAYVGLWVSEWQFIREFTASIWRVLSKIFTKGWDGITEWFKGAWNDFKGFWSDSWNNASDFLVNLWDSIKSMAAERWGQIKDTIIGVVNSIVDKINSFINFWNNLEFRVPTITVPSPFGGILARVGGFTVGTPNIGLIPRLKGGGLVNRGGMTLVGEEGPELLNLPRGAQVSPMGAGITINVHHQGDNWGLLDAKRFIEETIRDALQSGGFRDVLR